MMDSPRERKKMGKPDKLAPSPGGPLSPSLAQLLGVKSLRDIPEIRAAAEARHRALVIEDDYLCAEFGFSRKAKGKWVNER